MFCRLFILLHVIIDQKLGFMDSLIKRFYPQWNDSWKLFWTTLTFVSPCRFAWGFL